MLLLISNQFGLWSLGVLSFLAATILPFSSEVAVAGALAMDYPPLAVLLVASVGNGLACLVNYGLGYLLAPQTQRQLRKSRVGRKALIYSYKYRYGALLLSWTPILGDPITLAAGLLRMRLSIFSITVIGLRVARYLVIIYFFGGDAPL
jgi:membrane protein YqaA with SNARE-associated domain